MRQIHACRVAAPALGAFPVLQCNQAIARRGAMRAGNASLAGRPPVGSAVMGHLLPVVVAQAQPLADSVYPLSLIPSLTPRTDKCILRL